MEGGTWTYSTQKPLDKKLPKNDPVCDVIFGARKDDLFEDLSSNSSPLQQPKIKTRQKTTVKKNKDVPNEEENSFLLFQDDKIRQKKKTNTLKMRKQTGVGRKKSAVKKGGTLSSSDTNTSGELVIEKAAESDKKVPEVSKSSLKHLFSCDPENENSIEISRKSKVSFVSSPRRLACSPPVPIVTSDVDSDSSFQFRKTNANTDNVKFSTSETEWATVSSKSSDSPGSKRRETVSSYTYSICSAYSEDCAISSIFTKPMTTSPPVKMKKIPMKLNSTTNKNKDDIGVVQFPDFISPIWINQKATSCSKGSRQVVNRKPKENPKHKAVIDMLRHPPKCSTMLFAPDTGTSFTSSIEKLGQTTIQKGKVDPAGTKSNDKVWSPKKDHYVGESLNQDQEHLMTLKDTKKTSTPEKHFTALTFNMSPIDRPTFDDDETGMQINLSTEANTDEIIVPSLMEPSVYSGDEEHNKLCNMASISQFKHSSTAQSSLQMTNTANNISKKASPSTHKNWLGRSVQNTGSGTLEITRDNNVDNNSNKNVFTIVQTAEKKGNRMKTNNSYSLKSGTEIGNSSVLPKQNDQAKQGTCIAAAFNRDKKRSVTWCASVESLDSSRKGKLTDVASAISNDIEQMKTDEPDHQRVEPHCKAKKSRCVQKIGICFINKLCRLARGKLCQQSDSLNVDTSKLYQQSESLTVDTGKSDQ